jgi:uncharacterized membrane protein
MAYTTIIISALVFILLFMLFILEFVKIVEIIRKRKRRFLDTYAVLNSGLLLLIFASIHEYLFTEEIFEHGWWVLQAIIACAAVYEILKILEAKRIRDDKNGST